MLLFTFSSASISEAFAKPYLFQSTLVSLTECDIHVIISLLQCHILFSGVACPLVSGGYRFAPSATTAFVVVKCATPKFLSPPKLCFEVGDSFLRTC